MKFVKTDDVKDGMRLAKPIYNKKGVLLYERDSKLTGQSMASIRNFGLMGVYVLEPAEPLPPMSPEDEAIEKFLTVSEFRLMYELSEMIRTGKISKLRTIADSYLSESGRMSLPMKFIQNLRGAEDYVVKHSSNVALLCALLSREMGLFLEEQRDVVLAALVHDVGKLNIPAKLMAKEELDAEDIAEMKRQELYGADIIESCFTSTPSIKRTMLQAYKHIDAFENKKEKDSAKMVKTAKVLVVADMFDKLTAMSIQKEPISFISALKILMSNPDWFDPDVVKALERCVNFLGEGTSVELSNGEKALVLTTNPSNLLKPMVLVFSSNTIIDLARSSVYQGLEVVDTMKTLDSRYIMDKEAIDKLKNGASL
ncbi:MAG: HD domain-containing protein [Lachnospiraceae bacterium]|nr:HD domain-containing protein [Lachnospiraceae bacterium]